MQSSPRGNKIEKISGEPWDIQQRGRAMENLGMQMRESASILEKIKNGTEGKGYSVEKIKEVVDELHVDLARAGERYEPSGTVIRQYGEALGSVKYTINTIVDECEELWAIYVAAAGDVTDASNKTIPSDETPEQKQAREDAADELAGSKATAYANWHAEATKYDTPFDTWDDAYEVAVSGLRDVNDDGVKDGWWDDRLPLIEGLLIALAVAGIVLAVLACIIGGPLIALLAAIVAIATLVLTIIKLAQGRGGTSDLVWAIVGIIPFGRLASLGNLFKGGTKAGQFALGLLTDLSGITGFLQKSAVRKLPAIIDDATFLNSLGNKTGQNIVTKISNLGDDISELTLSGPAGWAQRLLGGGSGQLSAGMNAAFDAVSQKVGASVVNHFIKNADGTLTSTSLLPGSIDGLQNPLSLLDQGANLIDTAFKPINDTRIFIEERVDDFTSSSNMDSWQIQLSGSK